MIELMWPETADMVHPLVTTIIGHTDSSLLSAGGGNNN